MEVCLKILVQQGMVYYYYYPLSLLLSLLYCRPGFTVLELPNVPSGEYIVTATTYTENQEGPFFITASSDNVFNFEPCH